MKKLLLLTTILIGITCHGQTKHINIPDKFNQLEAKIDSLEKRITELENRCVVLHIDSIPAYYQTWGDSLVLEYDKRYMIKPFKIDEL